MTTRSWVPSALTSVLVASNAASPLVISTRATIAELNTAPTKVNPWAPRWAGDAMLASSTPFASKYSTRVAAALSRSEERRVGKEGSDGRWSDEETKQKK